MKWTTRTLFWHPAGPQLDYSTDGVLHVSDLNPEINLTWSMSRWELFRIGLRCLKTAFAR
jgi:hypothetical protein